MRHLKRWLSVAMICAVVLALGVPAVWAASPFKKFSRRHITYGVSQFWAGNVGGEQLRWANPIHLNMIAAAIFYDTVDVDTGGDSGDSETYLGCLVRELTPHASEYVDDGVIDNTFTGGSGNDNKQYTEIIAVPRDKIRVSRRRVRLADGLGIIVGGGTHMGDMRSVYPRLFNLPSDDVVSGQRQAAIDCLCAGVAALGASRRVFYDFDIECPEPIS